MRFIRFQSQLPIEGASSKLGIFQLAFMVRDAHETSIHDANEISRHLEWLKEHLHSPDELDEPENFRAICWFRPKAKEPIDRIWSMKPYIEAYGFFIDVVTTDDPGTIIYIDNWQVVAKPRRPGAKRRV